MMLSFFFFFFVTAILVNLVESFQFDVGKVKLIIVYNFKV